MEKHIEQHILLAIASLEEIRNHPDARHQIVQICNREIAHLRNVLLGSPYTELGEML